MHIVALLVLRHDEESEEKRGSYSIDHFIGGCYPLQMFLSSAAR